ncbi:FtsJ-domain-containing protein [Choiromyces venosus 120613-1]|uniref:rRNA methyltransferase 2, mitochondrial n=1 Tax=Choiromyces venosus 120613-1 TaxID=1336337 RepID=A0A3N4J0A4_9PEZI|nr:FtsJ-domain-containing protein [Choiromyces venosus 120613-1]
MRKVARGACWMVDKEGNVKLIHDRDDVVMVTTPECGSTDNCKPPSKLNATTPPPRHTPTHSAMKTKNMAATTTALRRIATSPSLLPPPSQTACTKILLTSTCTSSIQRRQSSSSSNSWKVRQARDVFAQSAKHNGYKSRAAYKLLEIDSLHKIFHCGQTVVDLGFAPGAWSQVAIDKVAPTGRVIGVDILPAQPPAGVSTFQGSMKSPGVRSLLKSFLMDPERGRMRQNRYLRKGGMDEEEFEAMERGYVDRERDVEREERFEKLAGADRPVDVVLSDMSDPWPITSFTWRKSFDNVFLRLMNTSGIPVRDHAYSIDLCYTALSFAIDVLRKPGIFVCKVYRGDQEEELRKRLGEVFASVCTEKPEASRDESKEVYYVAKWLRRGVSKKAVFPEGIY